MSGLIYSANRPGPTMPKRHFGKSLTKQSEAKACDINTIMAKYDKTGVLPITNRQAFFADVSTMTDYRGAVEQVAMADEVFMELPAKVRARFDNDAGAFLDFCSDSANRDEMRDMGLLEPLDEQPKPVVVEPVVVEPTD